MTTLDTPDPSPLGSPTPTPTLAAGSTLPRGFESHVFERRFEIDRPFEAVWAWLMRPETFTEGQPWPWRVEFLDTPMPDGSVARGFDVGTRNAHHGPFMNFCGRISRVESGADSAVRDLEYGYGAYALGFRLIRPTLLRISASRVDDGRTEVVVRIESAVRSWMAGPWTVAQRCFWPSFGWWMRRGVPRSR